MIRRAVRRLMDRKVTSRKLALIMMRRQRQAEKWILLTLRRM
jgi:hypothetical protein